MTLLQEHTPLKIKCIRHTSQLAGGSSLSQESAALELGGGLGGSHQTTSSSATTLHNQYADQRTHYNIIMLLSHWVTGPSKIQEFSLCQDLLDFTGGRKFTRIFFSWISEGAPSLWFLVTFIN